MLESELEPEFVSLLEVLRRPDPAVVPGSQQERSREVPAKLVTGAYLNRLKLPMVPFDCHLKFAPTLGVLFCRYEGEDLAEQLLLALEHWRRSSQPLSSPASANWPSPSRPTRGRSGRRAGRELPVISLQLAVAEVGLGVLGGIRVCSVCVICGCTLPDLDAGSLQVPSAIPA
jgi:hypothetical protein